jgi:hypothetical protein
MAYTAKVPVAVAPSAPPAQISGLMSAHPQPQPQGIQGLLSNFGERLMTAPGPESLISTQFLANAFTSGADNRNIMSGIPEAVQNRQIGLIKQQEAQAAEEERQRQIEESNKTAEWVKTNFPQYGNLPPEQGFRLAMNELQSRKSAGQDESFFGTLIQGTDANGNPIYLQPGNRGTLNQLDLPEGFAPQSRFDKVDLGNQWMITDTTTGQRQILPKSGDVPTGFQQDGSGGIAPMPNSDQERARQMEGLQAEQRVQAANQRADIVIGAIDTALDQANFFTTGPLGSAGRAIGATPMVDLEGTINTVKSNIGFNELQQMREMSPTGGALGGIAIQELEMLQSVIASLDPRQGEEQLRRNLATIKDLLERQKGYREAAMRERQAIGGGGASNPAPGGWQVLGVE